MSHSGHLSGQVQQRLLLIRHRHQFGAEELGKGLIGANKAMIQVGQDHGHAHMLESAPETLLSFPERLPVPGCVNSRGRSPANGRP